MSEETVRKVFISYGRADALDLAQRLRKMARERYGITRQAAEEEISSTHEAFLRIGQKDEE